MKELLAILSVYLVILLSRCIASEDSSNNPQLRILQGLPANESQFPWLVSIRDSRFYGNHTCGGSIISSQWILTAGHCVGYVDVIQQKIVVAKPKHITVATNSICVNSTEDVYNVSKIILHKAFFHLGVIFEKDIALIKLSEPLKTFTKIELDSEDVGIVNCTVAGWGRIADDGPPSLHLQYLDTKTIDLDECERRLNRAQLKLSDRKNQMCTYIEYGRDTCQGDSGGALVCNGKQVGIVSYGPSSCAEGITVYTKIPRFAFWINNKIAKN